jgi:hypothetical protein
LLTELSTEELRTLSGAVMAELRKRKQSSTATADTSAKAASTAPVAAPVATAKVRKPAEVKAAEKAAYMERKAEFESRAFGVICTSTGKTLKRRFASEVDALAAAEKLSAQMHRTYAVSLLAAA